MSGSGRSSRTTEQAALYEKKRKTTDMVRLRFARFGDKVLGVVLGFALQPKRMPILLQRCNLRVDHSLDAQLDSICGYVAAVGPRGFLRRLNPQKREEVQPVDLEEYIVEADIAAAEAEFLPPPETLVLHTPAYVGPERRFLPDRRIAPDRRNELVAVRKNKRYGGDRRKILHGRRKADHK